MGQTGVIGGKDIRAWAVGARTGYTFAQFAWQPRLGCRSMPLRETTIPATTCSGPSIRCFRTAIISRWPGFTGYVNLFHVKPSLTVKPAYQTCRSWARSASSGARPRRMRSTCSPTFRSPAPPAKAAPGRAPTGNLRVDYRFNAHLTGALEAVHYKIGDTIRSGGRSRQRLCRCRIEVCAVAAVPREVRSLPPTGGRCSLLLSLNAGFVDAAGFTCAAGLVYRHVTGNFVTLGASLVFGTTGAVAKAAGASGVLPGRDHDAPFGFSAVAAEIGRWTGRDEN